MAMPTSSPSGHGYGTEGKKHTTALGLTSCMGCGECDLIHLCAEGSKEPQEADPAARCVTPFPGDGNKSLLISDREPM